jgi:hypothetical protein
MHEAFGRYPQYHATPRSRPHPTNPLDKQHMASKLILDKKRKMTTYKFGVCWYCKDVFVDAHLQIRHQNRNNQTRLADAGISASCEQAHIAIPKFSIWELPFQVSLKFFPAQLISGKVCLLENWLWWRGWLFCLIFETQALTSLAKERKAAITSFWWCVHG